MNRARNSYFLLFFLSVLVTPFLIKTSNKNTCETYIDHLLINFNGRCYYNPDADLSAPQLIEKYTDSVKQYNVTTEDGYILTMFRIPRANPVGVILVQPPLTGDAAFFLLDGNQSLPFTLWSKGYDVWLSNPRGTTYSRKHVNLSESDLNFWQFGFHEIAMYDFEPQFELIAKETRSKFTYLGYSKSATEALIYSSLKPDSAAKYIDTFILAAPMTVLTHFSSIFKYLFDNADLISAGEVRIVDPVIWLAKWSTLSPYILNMLSTWGCGPTAMEVDQVFTAKIFAHSGKGITNRMLKHYGQIVNNGSHFVMFDYGRAVNMEKYGMEVPPPYPLQNVTNPVYILYADMDVISTPMDVKFLVENLLPAGVVKGVFNFESHNHVSPLFGKHRKETLYQTVLHIVDEIKNSNVLLCG